MGSTQGGMQDATLPLVSIHTAGAVQTLPGMPMHTTGLLVMIHPRRGQLLLLMILPRPPMVCDGMTKTHTHAHILSQRLCTPSTGTSSYERKQLVQEVIEVAKTVRDLEIKYAEVDVAGTKRLHRYACLCLCGDRFVCVCIH